MESVSFISEFKAIFNPFTKELLVKYGYAFISHTFEELEEWAAINYDDDQNQPYYLHVHLDYDESLQLLFYPRQDYDEFLNEDHGSYYNSASKPSENSPNIKLVYNDYEWDVYLRDFLGAKNNHYDSNRKVDYMNYKECLKITRNN